MLEPDLAHRLRAEAERLEVSDPPSTRITKSGRHRSRFRIAAKTLSVVALAAASAGLGLIVTGEDGRELAEPSQQSARSDQDFENFEPIFPPPTPRRGRGTTPNALTSGSVGQDNQAVAGGGSVGAASAGNAVSASGGTRSRPGAGGALSSPRVIKTARIRVEVGEDSFGASFAEAERLAARHGGFVSDSFTASRPARSGELTIRVPAAVFETVIADLKSLGSVESQRVSGVDVTAEFVDLEARLRNWDAQERVLVRLMSEANTIAESLQVQRELQSVRLEIERIHGQLRVLRDQTSLATISIAIHEPGVDEEDAPEDGLGGAWGRAMAAAGNVLGAMVVGLGYLVPIGAALIALWFVTRAVRSRRSN
jgi:hypothetical protein